MVSYILKVYYIDGVKRSIQQYVNGVDYGVVILPPMEKSRLRASLKMAKSR